jgi:hypothetical protein
VEQADLLRRAIDVLEDQRIVYLLVGSLASGVYGEPRLTADVDVVVELNLPATKSIRRMWTLGAENSISPPRHHSCGRGLE